MRTLNNYSGLKRVKVIRLKSDNYNCWVSEQVYTLITLEMSSGDYGAHKAVGLYIEPENLHKLTDSDKFEFIDVLFDGDSLNEPTHFIYYSQYDSVVEAIA